MQSLDAVLAGISYDAADPEAEALGTLSAQMPPDAVATLLEGLTARQEAAAAQAADALAALDRQLSTLQTALGAAEQAERQRQEVAGELTRARSTAQLESAKANTRRKTLEALNAALTASEAELAALADADTRRVELEAEAARLAQRETALNELARSLTECQHRNTAARTAQEAYRQAAGRQTEAHSARDTLERAFLDAQAGLLAQTLEEGAACPVCGSTHHPAKAHLPRTAPTEVQVNQAKQAAAQADSAAQEASAAAREALTREQEGRAQLRKDAEALLPERFTSPEGPVPLTMSLLRTALAEENDALHTAQADLKQRQTKNHTDCRRKKELEAHGIHDGILADLGCGTGELTLMLTQAGYDMIGIDQSEEMLCVVRDKAESAWPFRRPASFAAGPAQARPLRHHPGCGCPPSTPSTTSRTWTKPSPTPASFMEKGGVLLFDMNTPYKHRHILAGQTFDIEAEDADCHWSNRYDETAQRVDITINIDYHETGGHVPRGVQRVQLCAGHRVRPVGKVRLRRGQSRRRRELWPGARRQPALDHHGCQAIHTRGKS